MKHLIIIAVSLLGLGTFSYAGDVKKETSLIVLSKAPFENIVINGDIDIVLTESNNVQIEVKGEEKVVTGVKHFVKKGTLYLFAAKSAPEKKPTVYIQVSNLVYLEINGKSKVTSNGPLNSSKLRVMINGDVKFHVRNYGDILIESDEDIDLQFEKWVEDHAKAAIKPNAEIITEADLSMDAQLKLVDTSVAGN